MNKLVSLVKKIVAGPSLPPKTSRAQAVEPTFDLYDVTAFAAEIDLEALDGKDLIFADPMNATGGSLVTIVTYLEKQGIKPRSIRFFNVISACISKNSRI